MVESLTRTFNHAAGDDDQARGVSRVGTKSASSKLNIAHTIASNADVINAAKIERVQATDPMFYKMSKAFDDGGAKGMLMTNLVRDSTHFLGGISISLLSTIIQ
jgi:Condensin complex subunit 2